jgi:hypothetical protein
MGIAYSRFEKFSDIIFLNMLQIPFACTMIFSFFNAHDSQVWSCDGVGEFLHISFAGLELFD